MNLRTAVCGFPLCAFVLGFSPAYGGGFSIIAPTTVEQGAKGVTVSLFESAINGLEAADLLFTFDPSVFDYVSTDLGSALTSGFFLAAHDTVPGSVKISLSSGLPVTAASGSLVDVMLDVRDGAPLGALAFKLTFEATTTDYDVPPQEASLTVMPGGAAPEPLSTVLVAMGMLALSLFQRRPASRP